MTVNLYQTAIVGVGRGGGGGRHYLHTIKTKNEIIKLVIPHAMANWEETFMHKEMNHSLTFVFIVSFGILLYHFISVGVS